MLQNCFTLPVLQIDAYFIQSTWIPSLFYQNAVLYAYPVVVRRILYVGDVIIWYVQLQRLIERSSLFIFDFFARC